MYIGQVQAQENWAHINYLSILQEQQSHDFHAFAKAFQHMSEQTFKFFFFIFSHTRKITVVTHKLVFNGMLFKFSPLLRLQPATECNLITALTRGDKLEVGG